MKRIMNLLIVCVFTATIFVSCSANTNIIPSVNTIGNSCGNLHSGGTVAQQGDWIYYNKFPSGGLYKVKIDGTGKIKLNDDSAFAINVVGDWIYYHNDTGDAGSYKVKTD